MMDNELIRFLLLTVILVFYAILLYCVDSNVQTAMNLIVNKKGSKSK